MASVRVDRINDQRFSALGMLMGFDPLYAMSLGRGLMIEVWEQCTERHAYNLSSSILMGIGKRADFADLLVAAELAEKTDDGYRIRGTNGRIEWLQTKRENGKKGGRPHKNPNSEIDEPKENLNETETEPKSNPLALTLALTKKEEEAASPAAPVRTAGYMFLGDEVLAEFLEDVPFAAQEKWCKAYRDKPWLEHELRQCALKWDVIGPKDPRTPKILYISNWLQNAFKKKAEQVETKPPPPKPSPTGVVSPIESERTRQQMREIDNLPPPDPEAVRRMIQSVTKGI